MTRTEAADERVREHGPDIVAVRADNASALTLTGTQTYVIGREAVVVLDPGPVDETHLERVDAVIAGRPVRAVLLTHSHRDHSAAAGLAAARWGPLRGSAETLRRIGLEGVAIEDEEEIAIDEHVRLRAIATPGHASDHLAYLSLDARDLFTGDLVLGEGSSIIVHPDGAVAPYMASLARLVALRPARLIPGHGPVVNDPTRRLEAYRIHRIERTKHVLGAVEAGADTVPEIRRRVYWDLPETHHAAAEYSVRAYLAYLRDQGYEVPDPDA